MPMLTEQTIVTNTATNRQGNQECRPLWDEDPSVPGEQRGSATVPDEGEGYLEGMDAEGDDKFQLLSGYQLRQGGP